MPCAAPLPPADPPRASEPPRSSLIEGTSGPGRGSGAAVLALLLVCLCLAALDAAVAQPLPTPSGHDAWPYDPLAADPYALPAPPPEPAHTQLVTLTLGLYDAVLEVPIAYDDEGAQDHAKTCRAMAKVIRRYTDTHDLALRDAIARFKAHAAQLDPAALDALAATLRDAFFEDARVFDAQHRLFDCLKSKENQGRRRRVSKAMAHFHHLHDELLESLVGVLDD